MIEYRALSSYLKEKFGCKVYKLSLSCSGSCPNRDGTRGEGGCIFCSDGSGDFAQDCQMNIEKQLESAKKLVEKKAKTDRYIAYFASFTSTYGDPNFIKERILGAARDESVVAVSIGTRPDCLGEEMMEILREAKKIKPVWVELGLQSVQEKTARLINRGSELSEFDEAIKNLKAEGFEVILHIILGLPFETEEMMLESVGYAAKKGVDGVKLQLLHVLEGTRLAEMYKNGEFEVFSMEKYLEILEKAVEILPKNCVVHRLTGDGAKKKLIAPLWSANKKAVLNEINKRFKSI